MAIDDVGGADVFAFRLGPVDRETVRGSKAVDNDLTRPFAAHDHWYGLVMTLTAVNVGGDEVVAFGTTQSRRLSQRTDKRASAPSGSS